jgi:hypothetical protein
MEVIGQPGEELAGFSPNVPNSEYFQQVKLILQIIGVNFGLPLCLVLMDGSETNFSGWRGAVDEARKGFVADQMNLVRRLNKGAYKWRLWWDLQQPRSEFRKAFAKIGDVIFRHNWNLPTWSYIEPVADAQGDAEQLKNGLTSPRRLHAARGKDWEEIAEECIEDNAYAITRAQQMAAKINQQFPESPPINWRDLVALPMPEGMTMAMQDPAAVAVQEDAANAEEEAPKKPQAKAKRTPKAAKDGKWRTTDDGGKMFIGDDGDVNFGGPGGEPAKEAAPPKNPTHSVKLPPNKTKLSISTADKALQEMGFKLGRGNTDLKKKETSYEVTKPDGTTQKMSTDEIKKLVYDAAKAKAKQTPRANKDFDESKITRDDDGKFGGGGGSGGGNDGKSTGAKSTDLALPEPKMRVSAKSAKQMQEMIQEDLQQGKTLEESFAQYDDEIGRAHV